MSDQLDALGYALRMLNTRRAHAIDQAILNTRDEAGGILQAVFAPRPIPEWSNSPDVLRAQNASFGRQYKRQMIDYKDDNEDDKHTLCPGCDGLYVQMRLDRWVCVKGCG